MTLEELVIAVVRVLGSLAVLRWAFGGGVLAVLVDFSDLFLRNLLQLGGVRNYQSLDKWLDQVYMALFLVVVLRWPKPARNVAIALYGWRLVGFLAFEVTGARQLLVLFPNVFEFWYLFVAYVAPKPAVAGASAAVGSRGFFGRRFTFTRRGMVAALLVLLVAKEAQELVLHRFKLLDSFTAVEAVEAIWAWVSGPFG